MGRPPCCDKDGIKKGPWTPEEDIMLASYVQDHGPGNWRSVPKNTGLLRCSKSCRLRWTNYLRPGIKRGNFTEHEEKMIISLQSFLGNKWAAIAAYLPQRTDNDIKNYWNTHLKKKLKKLQLGFHNPNLTSYNASSAVFQFLNKSRRKNFDMIQYKTSTASSMSILPKLNKSFSSTSTYASSTENISRLLQGWIKSSPKASSTNHEIRSEQKAHDGEDDGGDGDDEKMNHTENSCSNSTSSNINFDEKKGDDFFLNTTPSKRNHQILNKVEDIEEICDHFMSQEELESLLTLENTSNIVWEKTSSDSNGSEINQSSTTTTTTTSIINKKNDSILDGLDHDQQELMELIQQPTTFSFLEKWLFDEITGEPLF